MRVLYSYRIASTEELTNMVDRWCHTVLEHGRTPKVGSSSPGASEIRTNARELNEYSLLSL